MLKSNWIKELHVKPETLKLIEEKVWKSLEDKVNMGNNPVFHSENKKHYKVMIVHLHVCP